jgi:hypothetical protein
MSRVNHHTHIAGYVRAFVAFGSDPYPWRPFEGMFGGSPYQDIPSRHAK